VLSGPWMTRDFTARKIADRRQKSVFSVDYWLLTGYIFAIPLLNRLVSPFCTHLEKRGILSCFWVLNSDDEVELVAR